MNRTTRLLCVVLGLVVVLSLPLVIPSGALVGEVKTRLLEEKWAREGEQSEETAEEPTQAPTARPAALCWLLPGALAETTAPIAPLPIDFTPGQTPNAAAFSENGYRDDSIEVKLETQEKDGVTYRIAYVTIADASQLRTATAKRDSFISTMAQKNNAVIAINGDFFNNEPDRKTFEYRMGQKIRAKLNKTKDLLIIDEKGDFHLFVKSKEKEIQAFRDAGHTIVNAFTFGPALIKDDTLLHMDEHYSYNPNGNEPRMAIGQMGQLSYVLVLAEGRTGTSDGVTHQHLADFMFSLGASQAYNLDGGNSATMVFNGGYYQTGRSQNNERPQSDLIYFASAIPGGQ